MRPVCSRPGAAKCLGLLGGRTRARTWDPLIKSQLLVGLYGFMVGESKASHEANHLFLFYN